MISKESLKGYIYIEAYKQTHVKQAIDGIGNLRMGQWSQQVCLDSGVLHEDYLHTIHQKLLFYSLNVNFLNLCSMCELFLVDGTHQRNDRCVKSCEGDSSVKTKTVGPLKEGYLQR